jgi:adenylate cyclase
MTTHPPLRRKLAAILAADVVGYSKKMGESEERTLRNLRLCRAITDGSIGNHHGRIFHTAGDSVIAEFASPVDAVMAAVEFQKTLRERNSSCDPRDQLEFRVGLNLGDVIIEGDNLYGEGINIAARIESIAAPGGVCVAHSVYSVVRKTLKGLEFSSRGMQSLKNIEEPVEVFDVSDDQLLRTEPELASVSEKTKPAMVKPIVLVESIKTVGGDEGITTLATGLFDGLIGSLMKSSAFSVVKLSSDTSKELPAQTGSHSQIRFKVTGSIQASGNKLRIFITLENAVTGAQIWSKRFDKTSDDIFDVQDEIVQKINLDIRHKIKEANFERLEAMPDGALLVPDLLDKAAGFFVRDGRHSVLKAEHCLDLAMALEPNHSMAICMKANCLDWKSDRTPHPVNETAIRDHLQLLDLAIQLDPRNYYALALKADHQLHRGAFKESIRTAELALRVFPDFDQAKATRSLSNFHLSGDTSHLESGKRLRYFFLHDVALAWFAADMPVKALEDAEFVFERMAGFAYPELCASVVICTYSPDCTNHPRVQLFLSSHPDLNSGNCRKPIFGNPQAASRFDAALEKLFGPSA